MHFRAWLIVLVCFYPTQEFTTSNIADWQIPKAAFAGLEADFYYKLRKKESKKISTVLDRLFKMGFLGRRLVDRGNIHVKGRLRKLGKEYSYRVTKQGEQYVRYLMDPISIKRKHKQKLIEKEIILSDHASNTIWQGSGQDIDLRNRLFSLHKGRYQRYHTRMNEEIELKYLVAREMLRQKGITDFEFDKKFAQARTMHEKLHEDDDENKGVIDRALENWIGREKPILSRAEGKELKTILMVPHPRTQEAMSKYSAQIPLSDGEKFEIAKIMELKENLSNWLKEVLHEKRVPG